MSLACSHGDPGSLLHLDLQQLKLLDEADVCRQLSDAEFDHILRCCDALWLHDGSPSSPHAELTSGKCSDGFVDVLRMLRHTNLCSIMAGQLVSRLYEHLDGPFDWVIGSDHAGATLSFAVASRLMAMHDFTEKEVVLGPDGKKIGEKQIWKRFQIEPDETVLQAEELITTTKTLQAVRAGIRAGTPHLVKFMPVVLTLVHRSDATTFVEAPIIYVRHYDIKTWEPSDCPLCKEGSKRLKPKQNWAELTGKRD